MDDFKGYEGDAPGKTTVEHESLWSEEPLAEVLTAQKHQAVQTQLKPRVAFPTSPFSWIRDVCLPSAAELQEDIWSAIHEAVQGPNGVAVSQNGFSVSNLAMGQY